MMHDDIWNAHSERGFIMKVDLRFHEFTPISNERRSEPPSLVLNLATGSYICRRQLFANLKGQEAQELPSNYWVKCS